MSFILPILDKSCASILPSYRFGCCYPSAAAVEYMEKKEFVRPLFSVELSYCKSFALGSGVYETLLWWFSLAPSESFIA